MTRKLIPISLENWEKVVGQYDEQATFLCVDKYSSVFVSSLCYHDSTDPYNMPKNCSMGCCYVDSGRRSTSIIPVDQLKELYYITQT